MWPEVDQAKNEKKFELKLDGPVVSQRIQEQNGELDPDIFELSVINFLQITLTSLVNIPPEIGRLNNMRNLVLSSNKIQCLPEEIGQLQKLKFLDISANEIEVLPDALNKLINLSTFIASNNNINAFPVLTDCAALARLDLRNNKLCSFAEICCGNLSLLADIYLSGNGIEEIPLEVTCLSSLKVLDVGNNSITIVPGEVIQCQKLKELYLIGNPLTDKRFKKLVASDRCVPRQVLDYIKQHCSKLSSDKDGNAKGPQRQIKQKYHKGAKMDEQEVDDLCKQLCITEMSPDVPVIKFSEDVKDIRPYIVCCVIRGLNLYGDNLKKFISAQTKLHEGICEKRLVATIATHNIAKVCSPLRYCVQPPPDIKIQPLSRGKPVTALEFFRGLQQESETRRKQQKRNNPTGIHKYLHLVEEWSRWPCLIDAAGTVISLPPITNAEKTKMTPEVTGILVEVTSSTSLTKAKQVMDSLVLAILHLGISSKTTDSGQSVLEIQQVRVENDDGSLRVIYPSRTDLTFEDEKVRVISHLSKATP